MGRRRGARGLRSVAAVVALWLLAVGCAADGDPPASSAPVTSAPTPTTSTVVDAAPDGRVLVAAGSSFGMCGGPCNSTITFEDPATGRFRWTATDHDGTLHGVASGSLTARERVRLGALLDGLPALDEVYGCPDCADGGAAHVTLEPGGTTTYPFGEPPEALRELDRWVAALLAAASTCDERDLVVLDAGCVPEGMVPIDERGADATR